MWDPLLPLHLPSGLILADSNKNRLGRQRSCSSRVPVGDEERWTSVQRGAPAIIDGRQKETHQQATYHADDEYSDDVAVRAA